MSGLYLRLPDPQLASPPAERLPLGRVMVNAGLISQRDLVHTLNMQREVDAPLGEILVAEGLVAPDDVLQMVSLQRNIPRADLVANPPDPDLSAQLPATACLEHRCVPWIKMGNILLVGATHPDDFERLCLTLADDTRPMLPVLVNASQVRQHIGPLYGAELIQIAENRVPAEYNCRSWTITTPRQTGFRAASRLNMQRGDG